MSRSEEDSEEMMRNLDIADHIPALKVCMSTD